MFNNHPAMSARGRKLTALTSRKANSRKTRVRVLTVDPLPFCWRKPNAVKDLHSKGVVRSVVEKGHGLKAVPVPSTALGYALSRLGQLQILELRGSRIDSTR